MVKMDVFHWCCIFLLGNLICNVYSSADFKTNPTYGYRPPAPSSGQRQRDDSQLLSLLATRRRQILQSRFNSHLSTIAEIVETTTQLNQLLGLPTKGISRIYIDIKDIRNQNAKKINNQGTSDERSTINILINNNKPNLVQKPISKLKNAEDQYQMNLEQYRYNVEDEKPTNETEVKLGTGDKLNSELEREVSLNGNQKIRKARIPIDLIQISQDTLGISETKNEDVENKDTDDILQVEESNNGLFILNLLNKTTETEKNNVSIDTKSIENNNQTLNTSNENVIVNKDETSQENNSEYDLSEVYQSDFKKISPNNTKKEIIENQDKPNRTLFMSDYLYNHFRPLDLQVPEEDMQPFLYFGRKIPLTKSNVPRNQLHFKIKAKDLVLLNKTKEQTQGDNLDSSLMDLSVERTNIANKPVNIRNVLSNRSLNGNRGYFRPKNNTLIQNITAVKTNRSRENITVTNIITDKPDIESIKNATNINKEGIPPLKDRYLRIRQNYLRNPNRTYFVIHKRNSMLKQNKLNTSEHGADLVFSDVNLSPVRIVETVNQAKPNRNETKLEKMTEKKENISSQSTRILSTNVVTSVSVKSSKYPQAEAISSLTASNFTTNNTSELNPTESSDKSKTTQFQIVVPDIDVSTKISTDITNSTEIKLITQPTTYISEDLELKTDVTVEANNSKVRTEKDFVTDVNTEVLKEETTILTVTESTSILPEPSTTASTTSTSTSTTTEATTASVKVETSPPTTSKVEELTSTSSTSTSTTPKVIEISTASSVTMVPKFPHRYKPEYSSISPPRYSTRRPMRTTTLKQEITSLKTRIFSTSSTVSSIESVTKYKKRFKVSTIPPETVISKKNTTNVDENNVAAYILAGLGVLPVAVIILFIIRNVHQRKLKDIDGESDILAESAPDKEKHSEIAKLPMLITDTSSRWEFPRSKLRLKTLLGEGNFGQVWKAEADDLKDHDGLTRLVAVKTIKDSASPKDREDFQRELSIMQKIGTHQNVVQLLGCCTEKEPHLVIMEYVMYGKLLTYLRDRRTRRDYYNFSDDAATLTSRDLTVFAYCVARGMEYLASKGIIHRDLAARNILVDHNKLCKISDFGMSRYSANGEVREPRQNRNALPVRWMATESLLYSLFTEKSDVWSFGILLWEIVTLGATPYANMSAREVMRCVCDGYRLERPSHCKPEVYRLMSRAWCADPSRRPSFAELRRELATMLDNSSVDYSYVDLESFAADSSVYEITTSHGGIGGGYCTLKGRVSEFECDI